MLYAPLYFFLTTPVGNLLVNFSRDQDIHDESLPDALHYAGIYGLILLATTITVSTQIELFSVMSVGLFIVTGLMLFAYLPTATQLKHLRNETAGQLVTLVAEALEGLTVIQAFDKQVCPFLPADAFDTVVTVLTPRNNLTMTCVLPRFA